MFGNFLVCAQADQFAVVEQKLQRHQPSDIRFGFFDGSVSILQFHPRIGLAIANLDLVWTDAVRQFMGDDLGEKRREIQVFLVFLCERDFRDGNQYAFELRLLHVFQHDPLAAFECDHPVVVGQVVGRRLDAVVAVARRENLVDHAQWRRRAQLGVAIGRIFWKIVLDLLQVAAQERQLGTFLVVADIDV